MTGRFAPSPTGALHVGNLRTALLAWSMARAGDEPFVVRMEDLDRANASPAHEARQLDELGAIGIDWDGPVVRQSERFPRYDAAIARLATAGLVYECYCTRREIRDAVAAPHGDLEAAYPGTCRDLDETERGRRRAVRPAALRLRAGAAEVTVVDELAGSFTAVVDDVVLRRNDGVPAYNLAVVVDDAAQGVTTVVRGDDLLASTPRQLLLQRLLGLPAVRYVHVPLVVGDDGARLAKRDGAVTLEELATIGIPPSRVRACLLASLGIGEHFDLDGVRARGRAPVRWTDLQRCLG